MNACGDNYSKTLQLAALGCRSPVPPGEKRFLMRGINIKFPESGLWGIPHLWLARGGRWVQH